MIITKAKINNAIKSPPIINPVQNSLILITTHHNTNSNNAKTNYHSQLLRLPIIHQPHEYQQEQNRTYKASYDCSNCEAKYKHYSSHLNTPSQKPQNPPTRIS